MRINMSLLVEVRYDVAVKKQLETSLEAFFCHAG